MHNFISHVLSLLWQVLASDRVEYFSQPLGIIVAGINDFTFQNYL